MTRIIIIIIIIIIYLNKQAERIEYEMNEKLSDFIN